MTRLGIWVACVAIVCAVIGVAPAAAAPLTRWDPQESNVPYLAWRGEHLRLVTCTPVIQVTNDWLGRKRAGVHQTFEWIVENWSDDSFARPSIVPGSAAFFVGTGEHNGEGCVKATFTSGAEGLAQIQVMVPRPRDWAYRHHFLAGWLTLESASIRELSASIGAGAAPGGGGVLGDPTGDGQFFAGDPPGRVQAQIIAALPLGPNWATLRDLNGAPYPSSIRLPTEANGSTYWDDLAHSLAATTIPAYASTPWQTWDVHDDRSRADGHVTTSVCGGAFAARDGVDSCVGAAVFGGDGQYAEAFGTLSAAPTIGPFDPLRPAETLLSDGKVDDGDVPMPAALLEFGIKPNAGGTDLGGAGALAVEDQSQAAGAPELARWQGVDKCIAYSRDNRCTSASGSHPATFPNVAPAPYGPAAHNHYAPFYRRWLPATGARIGTEVTDPANLWVVAEASGGDGLALVGNEPGHLGNKLYAYWNLVDILGYGPGGATSCLRRVGDSSKPDYRQRPSGPQRVEVLTDEHGEAQVYFTPGSDFFFDNLGITPDANGACDLEGVTTVGCADIQANAMYPFDRFNGDPPSNVLRKCIRSRFHKEVHCVQKGTTAPNNLAWICTALGIDVDGTPFTGERVCFVANGTGMRTFPFGTPGETEGTNRLCVWLDAAGMGAVEVFCSDQTATVTADFVDERIKRTDTFDCVKTPPPPPPTTTTKPTTTTTSTTTTTTTTTTTAVTPVPRPTTTITTTTTVAAPPPTTTTRPTTTVPPPTINDVCPNIPGTQAKLPAGKIKLHGKCVAKKKTVVKAKKHKKKPSVCVVRGKRVSPCVRGYG